MGNDAMNRTVSPAITRAGWITLGLVSLTQLLRLLDRQILAILAPRIKQDLGIGDAEMGLLYGTVFALFYATFSLPLGRLADGWTRTRLLALCIAFWSLATGSAAFATGFGLLALSRLGVGIGEAASQPAGTSLVYDHFPKPRRGLAMAVLAASIALGLGLSNLLGGVAADWWDLHFPGGTGMFGFSGWQFAFFVAALPGAVLALLLWRLPEPWRDRGIARRRGSCAIQGQRNAVRGHPAGQQLAGYGPAKGKSAAMAGQFWRVGRNHCGRRTDRGLVQRPVSAPVAAFRRTGDQSPCPAMERGRLCPLCPV